MEGWLQEEEHKDRVKEVVRFLLSEIRYLFKSSDYEWEEEARIVLVTTPDFHKIHHDTEDPERWKFYVEMEESFRPSKVWIGPSAQEDKTEIEEWVKEKEKAWAEDKKIEVNFSDILYKGWRGG